MSLNNKSLCDKHIQREGAKLDSFDPRTGAIVRGKLPYVAERVAEPVGCEFCLAEGTPSPASHKLKPTGE